MAVSTVKWFDQEKGYGFIVNPDGKDIFVHFSSILAEGFRSLGEGDQVEYELVDGEKGPYAAQVKCLVANPRPKPPVVRGPRVALPRGHRAQAGRAPRQRAVAP